jgi:hypothetical protein
MASAKSYRIAGNSVLDATTLGTGILNSSLTSVGTLSSLTVTGNVTADTSTLKVDSVNHRVGVVNASPAHPLDVVGDCNLSTGSKYKINNVDILGSMVTSVLPITLDVPNSRVGVNKTVPLYALDVTGTAHITGATTIDSDLTVTGFINLA